MTPRAQSCVSCGALSLATLLDRRYSFITAVSSKQGVSRILKLKGVSNGRKPLSLLCRDLATIQEYALGIDKTKYKTLRCCHPPGPPPRPASWPDANPAPNTRSHLPGPYTFILRASPALPKLVYRDGKRQPKRTLTYP